LSKIWFIIQRKLRHQISDAVIAAISFTVAFCMLFSSFGLVVYFASVLEHIRQYDKDLRSFSISSDSSHTQNDIRDIFSGNPHVAALMIEEEEKTDLLYNEKYTFEAYACTEKTMPEVVSGRGLDFQKGNEIILPDKMKMFDEESEKYVSIDSASLIGSTIKLYLYNIYDYTDVGLSYNLTVVGTYDSEKYLEDNYRGYISLKCAKMLHNYDIDYDSDNLSIKLYTDGIEYNESIVYIASENHLYYSSDSSSETMINILRVVSVILVFLLVGAATAVAGYAVRVDFQQNIKDYYMMKVFGYREDRLYSIISLKFIIISAVSLVISLPLVKVINSKIFSILYGKIQTGGLSLHMSSNAFILGILTFYIIILLSVAKYFLDFLKVRIQDI